MYSIPTRYTVMDSIIKIVLVVIICPLFYVIMGIIKD